MTNNLPARIGWVDAAKGIGLLCVILGHLNIPYVATWVYFFHMPLFFFLSGFVFSGGKYDLKTFLSKKVRSLVIPYFTLGGVIFLFWCILYALEGRCAADYLDMLRNFLVQEHFWTVWFLACLFLTELIYYGIHRALGKKPLAATAASTALCAFGIARYRLGWGSLPWNLDVALVAQFFFHLGFCCTALEPKLRRFDEWKLLPRLLGAGTMMALDLLLGFLCIRLSGASLDMSVGWYGNVLLIFPAALCGIAGVILLARSLRWKWLTWLGRNTMLIFAWHSRIVIVGCRTLFESFGIFQNGGLADTLGAAACTGFAIFALLVPATLAIRRSRFHGWFGL